MTPVHVVLSLSTKNAVVDTNEVISCQLNRNSAFTVIVSLDIDRKSYISQKYRLKRPGGGNPPGSKCWVCHFCLRHGSWCRPLGGRNYSSAPGIQSCNPHCGSSPYRGFESRWSVNWQSRYNAILRQADLVKFVCPGYSRDCFQRRNEWIVDRFARVIAVYNGEPGGTRNTTEYSRAKKVECLSV